MRVAYLDGRAQPFPSDAAEKGKSRAEDAPDSDLSFVSFIEYDHREQDQLEPVVLLYRCVALLF